MAPTWAGPGLFLQHIGSSSTFNKFQRLNLTQKNLNEISIFLAANGFSRIFDTSKKKQDAKVDAIPKSQKVQSFKNVQNVFMKNKKLRKRKRVPFVLGKCFRSSGIAC